MRKPNAILHMLLWGAGSGIILALLYIGFIAGLGGASIAEMLSFVVTTAGLAFVLGGGAGAILGLVDGIVLWLVMRNVPMPFTRRDMLAIRYRVYAAIGLTTSIGGFLLTSLAFGTSWFYYVGFLLFFPPLIAGIASAYAAHRYLFRLRLWSESLYGGQKEKAKNVERLEDKPKNETGYFSEEDAEAEQES
jgi:hypothetical protein